jgi:altronate dehydratase large subunit
MTSAGQFLGYHRPDGRVGVRNHLLVLSTGGLTGPTARRIGTALQGAVTVCLPYSSGLLGPDARLHGTAVEAFATHPNVGAVVMVGDNPPVMARAVEAVERAGKPHAAFTLDDCNHDALTLTDRALRAGAALAVEISDQRRAAAPLSALSVGLECGRSDPSSGLVANPLLGVICDRLVDAGGTAIIGETLEWLGAEHLLEQRARSPEVATAIREAVLARERLAVSYGIDLTGSNPTPTNVAAGLSSIEEKSLGNIAKSGNRPIEGLVAYGERPPAPGLWTMDVSAYAPKSVTGFVVAGAQLLLFTTGVGNSYVSALAPTLKLSANPVTCAALGQQLDFDAGDAFRGRVTIDHAADLLESRMVEIASGRATWGEVLKEGDEVLSRFAPAL